MKRIIATVAAFAALASMTAHAEVYPNCGVVTEVTENGILIAEFSGGDVWAWKGDPEDIMEGDIIAMLMDDMGTESVLDDQIVEFRYCGWLY